MTEHFLQGRFYQTNLLMVVAYAIMFFPLAVVAVRAAVARAPVGLEEVAGSLGVSRRSVMWRVTLPLVGPGLGRRLRAGVPRDGDRAHGHPRSPSHECGDAGDAVLGLRANVSYYQAALYAGVMVLIAAVPGYVLGRWFDRQPARMAAVGQSELETSTTMVSA